MVENIWRYVFSIGRVPAGRSTPINMAYLATNTAHGLCAAFYACHGSPHFFGALAMRKTSFSQEKHQHTQYPEY
eukprot:6183157-Pleurochrysis_carterae.AAC.1